MRRSEEERSIDEVAPGSHYSLVRSFGIKLLKNKLSEYVRAVSAGETVLVTDRDRVVAELRPPPVDPSARINAVRHARVQPVLTEFDERGVREGWLTPPTRFGPLPDPAGLPHVDLEQILEDLDSDRDDR